MDNSVLQPQNGSMPPQVPETVEDQLKDIRRLLAEQQQAAEKAAKSRRLLNILLGCLVVVIALSAVVTTSVLAQAVADVPMLIQQTTALVEELQQVAQEIGSVNFDSLSGVVQGIEEGLGGLNFEELSQSIIDLQAVVESLANITSIFR